MRRYLVYLAPALLCAVALTHTVLLSYTPLSPWKLGGFGMFAAVDGARFLRATLLIEPDERAKHDKQAKLKVPLGRALRSHPEFTRLFRHVRVLPVDPLLSQAGDTLLSDAGVWAHCPPRHTRPAARDVPIDGQSVHWLALDEVMPAGCRSLQVARVRLEVWQHVYDPSTSRLLAKRLASARRPQP